MPYLITQSLRRKAILCDPRFLRRRLGHNRDSVTFDTRSGPLAVVREGDRLVMDFPAHPAALIESAAGIGGVAGALGVEPEAVLAALYALAVLDSEATVRTVRQDFRRIAALDNPELIVTCPARIAISSRGSSRRRPGSTKIRSLVRRTAS